MTCPDRPSRPSNRPGLPTLRYQIGDYAAFRARLIERLTCAFVTADQPQGISLRKLNTRAPEDPAIALLDACAVVADVLTFYQERIINEGYLLTATERRSVLELARMIGYELQPGVAASTLLAFTVEDTPNSPKTALVAKGTQILSVPEQDELPQIFETSVDFTAHAEWNALKPRPARAQKITPTTDRLFLKGTSTGLQPGDLLLLLNGDDFRHPYFLTIDRVEPNTAGYTRVSWQPQLLDPPPQNPVTIAFRQRANLFGFNAPRWETVADAIKLATGSPIKGGVYRASEGAEPLWQSVNTGLLSFDVRCLAITAGGILLAGTPIGLFRSKDNGETWSLANSGLTNFSIQTIFVGEHLLVGTPGGGLFRSTDEGETWSPIGTGSITVRLTQSGSTQTSEPINTGIPNTVVRSLTTTSLTFTAPTLSSSNTTVQITRGASVLPLNLQIGDVIVANNQTRTVTAVTIADPADVNAPLVVTINDSFRSIPTIAFPVGIPINLGANTTFFAYRSSSDAVSSPLLPTVLGGSLILAATDAGLYRSNDLGKNWYRSDNPEGQPIRALATVPGFVFARTDRGIYRSTNLGESWIATNLANAGKTIRSLVVSGNNAFAAASDGVYRSRSDGDWDQTISGLTDRDVGSIAVRDINNLFAFTRSGVFRSINQGNSWTIWSGAVQNPDLTAAVTGAKPGVGNSTLLFAGSAFTGFEQQGEEGWKDFRLPTAAPGEPFQIDLSTTYSKLLEKSLIVLQSGDRKTNQLCQIDSIAEVQRRDFTLDAKISRILTNTFIDQPEQFNLRETIVLAQSELLPLIDEPLTVTVQQANIFFDPIWDNKVLLSQYVAGLQAEHPVIVSGKRIRAALLNAGGIVQLPPAGNRQRSRNQPESSQGQSSSQELRWQRANSGLINTSVNAFASHQKPEVGTVFSNPNAVRGVDTGFTAELKVGVSISAGGQTKTIQAIHSNHSLLIDSAFNPELTNETVFQYTGQGTGTIASQETIVTGSKTQFTQELKVGVTLIIGNPAIGEQKRQVTKIQSDTSLVVDAAFNPELPPGTGFRYEGTGTGRIQIDRTAVQGRGTRFTEDLQSGQAISIEETTYRIERIMDAALLFVDADLVPSVSSHTFSSHTFSSSTLFAATAGGVFRSIDNGASWEAINQGLPTLMIQAIAVRSIQTQREAAGYQLFVGTSIGVFYTNPIAYLDDKVEWNPINGNSAYADVRALLPIDLTVNDRSGILLAGTINGGVLLLVQEGNQLSWTQTGLAEVDVQTLMRAANGDIFAGTVADRVFRGTVSDRGMTWQSLSKGLEDNPNVTCLMSYEKSGSGRITSSGTTVIGEISGELITRFTAELAIGDTIAVTLPNTNTTRTQRVKRIFSDSRLEIDAEFSTDTIEVAEFKITRIFAGTPGSGIFRLKPDTDQQPIWEPVANNPADLNVLCLTAAPAGKTLYAGTASGGIFQSIDEGNLWTAINSGLTSLDAQINPAAKVNTEFRAIAFVNQTLFAVGRGTLISPDNLYTIPLRTGDRLQVMAPPDPLPDKGRETADPVREQKWRLSDRDGLLGIVFTAEPTDVLLQAADPADSPVSEQNTIALPPQDQQEPLLTLTDPLQNSYDPQTVQIYANVVPATHGETVQEILGNGDSTLTHQQFILQKPPLTYISATTPSGAATTLQVRVNEILWQEVPSLYQRSPRQPVYITQIADDRSVTITLGDGSSGARLPTGIENVTATYRTGIGLAGQVGADRLTLLKTRPLGISEVTNPLPATGAADPETMAEARISAPLTVRTLDRIVSLQDYEDFARAFAGIGKAQADLLTAGETQLVHITVAAIGGKPVLPDTSLYQNLVQAIDAARDPVQQVRVSSYESIAFNLEARLLLDPRYLSDRVIAQAKSALSQRFAFERRQFGQPVTASEAIATLQAVAGMIAVDLDALHRSDRVRSLEQSVVALPARWDAVSRQILPAQMLVINSAGIRLNVEAAL